MGSTVALQAADGLGGSNAWTMLETRRLTNTTWSFDALEPGAGQRFYRTWVQSVERPATPPGMVWLPPGTFTMGSPLSDPDYVANEGPQTEVLLSQGFFLGQHEVTQKEYLALMGSNPATFTGDLSRPMETVSWAEALAYCAVLTQQEQTAGRIPAAWRYRLPTEAEWEYAARAGGVGRFGSAGETTGEYA